MTETQKKEIAKSVSDISSKTIRHLKVVEIVTKNFGYDTLAASPTIIEINRILEDNDISKRLFNQPLI